MALPELSYYIIDPTVDAITSEPFRVSELVGPYVFLDKSTSQTIFGNWTVEILTPDQTWEFVEELSTFDERFLLPGPGVYRIVKTASNFEYGVFINRARTSPDWLIEPTTAKVISDETILVEDLASTLVMVNATADGDNFDERVQLDTLSPDAEWIQTDVWRFQSKDVSRRVALTERGIYRVRKQAGVNEIGVFVYLQ